MAYDDYTNDPEVSSQLWNQYYANQTTPESVPYGFQFNQNQMIADALRGYGQDPYFTEATYMPGYEDTLTRKLIEKNANGQTTTQPARQQGGMQMPNMNMMQGMMGGSGFAPSAAAATPGTGLMDFGAGFGTTGGSMVNAGASSVPMGSMDFASSGAASTQGTGLMDFGSAFGSTGSSATGAGASSGADSAAVTAAGAEGSIPILGTIGGATAGYLAGRDNYNSDPNMRNGKDGYGKYHRDWRAEVGGGTLGGVMGMFGYGAAAYPAVRAAHYVMEPVTRAGINAGDKVGGVGGAMMVDPLGTASSGKYSWSDIGKGALLGPAKKWLGW
jgi:hypothetical protein